MPHKRHKQDTQALIEVIDQTKLKVRDSHELELLISLLMNAVFSTIAHSYKSLSVTKDYSVEQAIEEFKLKLSWLKEGAYK